jgi:hypothetical protein
MSEKIVKLGIARDPDLLYFIRDGDVWAVPRRKPGQPPEPERKIADGAVEMDMTRYLYFLDEDGDLARVERRALAPESL